MSTQVDYHLSIRVDKPKTVMEGEPFKVTYHIKNIGKNVFPGGKIVVKVSWAQLGVHVTVPIEITTALQPNDDFSYSKQRTPLASGYTMFTPLFAPGKKFVQIPRGRVFLYLEDGRPLVQDMVFGAVRAKSHEEISQARQVRVALIALFLIVIFQFVDWVLRYYYPPPYVKTLVTTASVGLTASL